MRFLAVKDDEARLRLAASVDGLAAQTPVVSARRLLSVGQRRGLLVVLVVVVASFVLWPLATATAIASFITALYLSMVVYRIVLFVRSTKSDVVLTVSDEEARAVPDHGLPTYTLLIPAYKEPEVIRLLLENIGRIEYPADRLEVMVLVEADDVETIEALKGADPGPQFETVLIPPADPRTKPKALNYGLSLARGELIAVYDAEDEPDPLQLRRAVVGFSRVGPEVVCIQSKLSYHNPMQNIITRWFTIEYAMWFTYFLPGLASTTAPIPLGGTSNHFRANVLRAMGAWDPFNVTEDADLGIRMFREGYRVAVLDSVTLEEANSDFVNWMRQRSRWYKGYLQTFLVHLREPRKFASEVGAAGFGHFCMFVGGTPTLALLNPVFWLLLPIWFIFHPGWLLQLFPAPIYYAALLSWCIGNFLIWYLTIISCRLVRRGELLLAAVLVPLYWVMMSLAAIKAFWQLVAAPTFWEKTFHGLDSSAPITSPDG
jgi:cellulose synthase/poly-beta-1,6-N-acetylglucosamine synthase-like glycosyltransferase